MKAIDKAIKHVGSQKKLAEKVGVSAMAVSHWRRRGIPARKVEKISAVTGGAVTKNELRPDIFDRK